MMLYIFIHKLTGRVFKVLPLREAELEGEDMHVSSYVESLARDMKGAFDTFPELCSIPEYITAVNIVQYMNRNMVTREVCKQEVFKALGLLNEVERKLGGENHA